MRILEYLKVGKYRITEFFCYTICGIEFYRNYDRFYWKNKSTTLPYQKNYYF